MIFLALYFLLAAVMFFQGLHLQSEVTEPLGTVPEEVAQAPAPSAKWGSFLMVYGAMATAVGLAGFWWPFFEPLRRPVLYVGLGGLAVFAIWLLFVAPKVDYVGKPSASDHGHGHH